MRQQQYEPDAVGGDDEPEAAEDTRAEFASEVPGNDDDDSQH